MASTGKNKSIARTEFKLVEFEFCWEIQNFSLIPYSVILKSPIFEGGSLKWQLHMTPYSNYETDKYTYTYPKGGILFTLNPIGLAPENCLAIHDLHIETKNKDKKDIIIKCSCQKAIPNLLCFYNWENIDDLKTYFPKIDFEDDTFRLICKVKLYNPEFVKSVLLSPIDEAGDKFRDDWSKLFQSKENSNISIKVGGGDDILLAHKLVLSTRSKVFARMFAVEMKESAKNVIQIDDFEVEDVNALLEFIYTGQMEGVQKNPEILIQLAEKYDLPDLKSICGVQLSQGITIENVIERLYLADRLNIPNLKSFLEKFIYMNKKELAKNEAFKEFASSELFLKMCANIFSGII